MNNKPEILPAVLGVAVAAFVAYLITVPLISNKDEAIGDLENKVTELENESKAKEEESEKLKKAEDKAREEKERASIKEEIDNLKKQVNTKPKASPVKYGPGNQNHLNGPVEGFVKVCTSSANGQLTLRAAPDVSGAKILLINNGVSDVYYFNRQKIGDYVWYQVDYFGNIGYLRGDYLCA